MILINCSRSFWVSQYAVYHHPDFVLPAWKLTLINIIGDTCVFQTISCHNCCCENGLSGRTKLGSLDPSRAHSCNKVLIIYVLGGESEDNVTGICRNFFLLNLISFFGGKSQRSCRPDVKTRITCTSFKKQKHLHHHSNFLYPRTDDRLLLYVRHSPIEAQDGLIIIMTRR